MIDESCKHVEQRRPVFGPRLAESEDCCCCNAEQQAQPRQMVGMKGRPDEGFDENTRRPLIKRIAHPPSPHRQRDIPWCETMRRHPGLLPGPDAVHRSEERRVGKECVRTVKSRGGAY